jgi:hypothetical protein
MPAIEIIEWFDAVDVRTAKVVTDLPAGYYCRITRGSLGSGTAWHVKTKNGSKPSIRYYVYTSLDEAYAFGVRWAKRQHKALSK